MLGTEVVYQNVTFCNTFVFDRPYIINTKCFSLESKFLDERFPLFVIFIYLYFLFILFLNKVVCFRQGDLYCASFYEIVYTIIEQIGFHNEPKIKETFMTLMDLIFFGSSPGSNDAGSNEIHYEDE